MKKDQESRAVLLPAELYGRIEERVKARESFQRGRGGRGQEKPECIGVFRLEIMEIT